MWVGIIFLVPGDINFVGSKLGIIQKKHLTNACTICDTVVEISICGQGLPMKATGIGPPLTMMIPQYLNHKYNLNCPSEYCAWKVIV